MCLVLVCGEIARRPDDDSDSDWFSAGVCCLLYLIGSLLGAQPSLLHTKKNTMTDDVILIVASQDSEPIDHTCTNIPREGLSRSAATIILLLELGDRGDSRVVVLVLSCECK